LLKRGAVSAQLVLLAAISKRQTRLQPQHRAALRLETTEPAYAECLSVSAIVPYAFQLPG